MIYQVIDSKH